MLSPLRIGRVTGSVAGAILGLDPLKTRAQVLRQMVRASHGCPDEFIGNIATQYGKMNEPLAIISYFGKTGDMPEDSEFLIHPDHWWLGATPDGHPRENGVLEVKCPFGKRNTFPVDFKPLAEQPHYYAQVQIEMACAGAEWAHFYQWSKWGDSLKEVPLDPEWHAANIPLLKEFHDLYLSELNNPAHLEPRSVICDFAV